jgi:hypothetical protein
MGADLIGVLVFGPEKIDVAIAEKAAAELWGRVQDHPYFCHACRTDNKIHCQEEDCSNCDNCGSDLSDYETLKTYEDCRNLVMEFVENWPFMGARDAAVRSLVAKDFKIEGQVVVFAGDMTWGDDPDGFAYTWLKRAEVLGFDFDLGIG